MLKDSIDTIDKLTVICFSPTRTSRKIAEAVAAGMTGMSGGTADYADASRQIRTIDLTLDRSDEPIILTSGETVVLGAPVYAGRVAPEAVRRLKRIQVAAGASIPAVITVTYGNRDYEDALVEFYDLALSLGLIPFAAGAFIGEHSYSTPAMPIAEGRPDSMDLADASIFGGECARKLESPGAFAPFHIKGNRPYKEPARPSTPTAASQPHSGTASTPAVPVSADGCPLCGECAAVCPTGAIVLDSGSMKGSMKVLTDPSLCIRCCACVKACPAGMRTYSTPFTAFLHEHCSARRDPETFL